MVEDPQNTKSLAVSLAIKNKARVIIVTKQKLSKFIKGNLELMAELNGVDYLLLSEYEENKIEEHKLNIKSDYSYRLIVGISKAIIIFQTNEVSRVNKIVNLALADGKEIFVTPETIFSKYKITNSLIKQGGKIIESANDILNDL